MTPFICKTCGTQYADSAAPPARCPICEDERQYVGWDGQQWTTLAELQAEHRVEVWEEAPGLHGVGMNPNMMIGQRALLVPGEGGNVLWDCIPLIDDAAVEEVRKLGGLRAIAISHPHYYSAMVEWARTFDAPVYLHAADREWVQRPDPRIHFWEGETHDLGGGLTLIRCGGHFPGGTVLHWPQGAGGRGALLSGDIIDVAMDRGWVSFMYSYPNFIPLSAACVRRIVAAAEPFAFEQIYGAWTGRIVKADAKNVVRRSAERYIAMLERP